ncbi:MAG: hypothetical protein JRN21_06475 [Nitrososphaerota archaeon]|nr:hypothetical protein [Nitrososphaerota archaeon]
MSSDEISEEVMEEGAYHLTQIGLTKEEVASRFEIQPERVRVLVESYRTKLETGEVHASEFDRVFWEDVKKEAEGDVKVTFLSDKGFHHAWKSELRKLDGPALMSIYESSRDFLGADPNQKFLDYAPPKGYDPLAMDREVRKAVEVIEDLLSEKWEEQKGRAMKKTVKP